MLNECRTQADACDRQHSEDKHIRLSNALSSLVTDYAALTSGLTWMLSDEVVWDGGQQTRVSVVEFCRADVMDSPRRSAEPIALAVMSRSPTTPPFWLASRSKDRCSWTSVVLCSVSCFGGSLKAWK